MNLKISHKTTYTFNNIVPRLIQSLKLYPSICKNQKIIEWKVSSNKGLIIDSHCDALGHKISNIYHENLIGKQTILSEGKIKTKNYFGTILGLKEKVNALCFLRFTKLTNPGPKIIELSKQISTKQNKIQLCHDLNLLVSKVIKLLYSCMGRIVY